MATVDILMATYNGEHYVREQIESIQAQTFEDWRLLVSDDCSTDGTLEIVQNMVADDQRIKVVSIGVHHGSAGANFMSLLDYAEAPYIMFCDQDDIWVSNKIELSISRMRDLERAHSSEVPLLVFTDMRVVDANKTVIHASFEEVSNIDPSRTSFNNLIAQSVGAGCTMTVNREAVAFALLAKDANCIIMHDWWLCLVCSAFGHIEYINEQTILYRQHGSNEVGVKNYSPITRAIHFNEMRKSVSATVDQARAFRDIYGGILSETKKNDLDKFVLSGTKKGFVAVFNLVRSSCWKKGLRKIGQIAVAFIGGK